jgi:SulP family sulfate permease
MEKIEVAYESNEFDGDDPEAVDNIKAPKGVEIYEINGPFFFGVADKFSDEIGRVEATPKVIIIRMRYVPAIDATGIFALESFILRSRKVGTEIVLSGVKRTPKRILIKMGIAKLIGTKNITDHLDSSIARAKQLLEDQKQTLNP